MNAMICQIGKKYDIYGCISSWYDICSIKYKIQSIMKKISLGDYIDCSGYGVDDSSYGELYKTPDEVWLDKLEVVLDWWAEDFDQLRKKVGYETFERIVGDTWWAYKNGLYPIKRKYGNDTSCVKKKVHDLLVNFVRGKKIELRLEGVVISMTNNPIDVVSLDDAPCAYEVADDVDVSEFEMSGSGEVFGTDLTEDNLREIMMMSDGKHIRRVKIAMEKFLKEGVDSAPKDVLDRVSYLLNEVYPKLKKEWTSAKRHRYYEEKIKVDSRQN